jgi:hypothetical protein
MALARNEINPLSVLGVRRLSFIPRHFTKFVTPEVKNILILDHWINYNLNSRYAITKGITLDNKNRWSNVIEIGLEDPAEMSMLLLSCPHITKKET